MNKMVATMFGISVFTGVGYLIFAHTPIGHASLVKWLSAKWQGIAGAKNVKIDREVLKADLKKLTYRELELLAAYTLMKAYIAKRPQKTGAKRIARTEKMARDIKGRNIDRHPGIHAFFRKTGFLHQNKKNGNP